MPPSGRPIALDDIDAHKLGRRGDRQAAQHQTVEQREDGGVGPDSDREREDARGRENRTLDQPTQAVAHVGAKGLQPDEQIALAGVLALRV